MKFSRRTLSGFEIAFLDCTGHSFVKHSHDEFVVGANLIGREHIWLDGACHEAQTSEVTLYNPGQIQSGNARGFPWSFVSIYVDPTWLNSQLGSETDLFFERPVATHARLAGAVRQLGRFAFKTTTTDMELIEGMLSILTPLFCELGSVKKMVRPRSTLREAMIIRDRLLSDLANPPSIDDIASDINLSSVQVVRAFKGSFGLPPYQWLNVERLKRARTILQSEYRDLAGLAVNLGFADQPHFTRRFREMYGVTPAVYAKS